MNEQEIWGGVECTLNRVGDHYFNQCHFNGHERRISDLELFKSLGIKKLRYPCLWELVAPDSLDRCDWSYLDERLLKLQKLGLEAIAGLLHHGSGPRYTCLIDPEFPEKFATFARLFARRYPWVTDYTPINEINTTARFSLLYGHWYPHQKSEFQYLKGMILQCKATVLAMREIRVVNPKARLIQTDDLGKCQSTHELIYQRDFENERRWLSWDLLSGKVNQIHPLYQWLRDGGISESELQWFEANPCPPDVIGVNHYHLSNRYLDHRLGLFPESFQGGNGKDSYVDIGAVDTGLVEPVPIEVLLRETWERFGSPIAVTECHTRGYRESQMRWFHQVWSTCHRLRDEGIDIEAVTAWSLLGTYNWNTLCTRDENFYEPGVFDLRNPEEKPQATALTGLIQALSHKKEVHPVTVAQGPWETGRRILYNAEIGQMSSLSHPLTSRPLLILGSTGTLGQAFARIAGERNIHYHLAGREEVDITKRESLGAIVEKISPWGIINATGYVRIDDAEEDKASCIAINTTGALNLALVARERSLPLVTFSSDQVFGGDSISPYTEHDHPSPLNTYGRSKAECEQRLLTLYPTSLIIRTSAFFGPWDRQNFITKMLSELAKGHEVLVPSDIFITPTYVPDLVHETLTLLIDQESGIFHLTNRGEVTWEEFAHLALRLSGDKRLRRDLLISKKSHALNFRAERPKRSSLMSRKQSRMSDLETAMKNYFRDRKETTQ